MFMEQVARQGRSPIAESGARVGQLRGLISASFCVFGRPSRRHLRSGIRMVLRS